MDDRYANSGHDFTSASSNSYKNERAHDGSVHVANDNTDPVSMPDRLAWDQLGAASRVRLLKRVAASHGYCEDYEPDLRFEHWLVPSGVSPVEFRVNAAVIPWDFDSSYAAIVNPLLGNGPYFLVFGLHADFQFGEEWKYIVELEYLAPADKRYAASWASADLGDNVDGLSITVAPGCDSFDLSIHGGVSAELLRNDVAEALYGLADLFALEALRRSFCEGSNYDALGNDASEVC